MLAGCAARTESATERAEASPSKSVVALFAPKSPAVTRADSEILTPTSLSHDENSAFAVSFRSQNQIGGKSGRQSTLGQSRKDQSRIPAAPGRVPTSENVSRSICRVRKSYPRGYFFAPDLNVKGIGRRPRAFRTRAPSRTYAFDDARRAHARVPHDFVRARIHPHVAGTRHRPIVGRPSVRVAGAFSRAPVKMQAHGQTVRGTAPTLARARASARGTHHAAAARIVQVRPTLLFVSRRGRAKRARTPRHRTQSCECPVTRG